MTAALDAGMDAANIAFAGPGKTDAELMQALAAGILIELESEGELQRLAAAAQRSGYPARVAIRINPDFVLKGSRSEERRVGKECVSTCRSRWSPYHSKQKILA